LQWLPALNDSEAREVFQSLALFTIGDCRKILFWRDRWIHECTLEEIAPAVKALVETRRTNSRLAVHALTENNWIKDIPGDMTVESCVQCVKLLSRLTGLSEMNMGWIASPGRELNLGNIQRKELMPCCATETLDRP
jgi:hypothetical protein